MSTEADKYQLFGRLRDEEFAALETDILNRGVQVPVDIDENGNTLDGHHRKEIADKHGLPYPKVTRKFASESDKREHVIKLNLCRRHLEPWQWGDGFKMLLKERGIERKRGAPCKGDNSAKMEELSREIGVPLSTAEKRLAQSDAVAKLSAKERKAVQNRETTVTHIKREKKEKAREVKRKQDAKKVAKTTSLKSLLASGVTFSTITIDPPWDWGDEGDVDQKGRARPTYATMSLEKLLKLPIDKLADKNAHLYLWITNRSLPKGFGLLEKWGFRYITALTWCKPSFGMGNYFRGQTEHVLFGVKGSQPLKRKDVGTWFAAPRGPLGHSSKPTEFYDLLESCSPGPPFLEIFARGKRPGWVSIGVVADG